MICKVCGSQVESNVKFCPKCGAQMPASSSNAHPTKNDKGKSKTGLIIALVSILSFLVVGTIFTVVKILPGSSKDDTSLTINNFENGATDSQQPTYENYTPSYMPQCVGWTKAQVEQYFSAYNNVTYTYEYSDSVTANNVISQNISVSTEITPASKIVFVISMGPDICPEKYRQKIVVTGSSHSHNAKMELFSWENGGWKSEYSCKATVGKNGIGANYGEGKGVTPMGTFRLGIILSKKPITTTAWNVEIVTKNTCIVDDPASPYYNTITNINSLPSGVHYDSVGKTILGGYSTMCMYIEHNGNGLSSANVIPGKGSAITICGKPRKLAATAGCIDISSKDMENIISKLDITSDPHIEIVAN